MKAEGEKIMQEPMRILQVVTIMNRGGLETMLMNYYRNIDRDVIQFDFMVHRPERGAYDDEIETLGGRIYRMPPISPANFFRYCHDLDVFFRQHQEYSIVHSHLEALSSPVLLFAKRHNVSHRIAHSHSTSYRDSGIRKIFKMVSRSCIPFAATQYCACGTDAGRFLFGEKIIRSNKFFIMKNAIDTEQFKFNLGTRETIRACLDLTNAFVIGHVGRFDAQKNHAFIIKVFIECQKIIPNAKLLLVGDGPLRSEIEKEAQQTGLVSDIIFTGTISNVSDFLMAMDVFLFPSICEGLPVSALEAQCAGLPVIASTGVPKQVNITQNVYFLSLKDDAKMWAQKIQETSRDASLSQVVTSEYDVHACAADLTMFYKNLHSEKGKL